MATDINAGHSGRHRSTSSFCRQHCAFGPRGTGVVRPGLTYGCLATTGVERIRIQSFNASKVDPDEQQSRTEICPRAGKWPGAGSGRLLPPNWPTRRCSLAAVRSFGNVALALPVEVADAAERAAYPETTTRRRGTPAGAAASRPEQVLLRTSTIATIAANRCFVPTGVAIEPYLCSPAASKLSGNFLNWAAATRRSIRSGSCVTEAAIIVA